MKNIFIFLVFMLMSINTGVAFAQASKTNLSDITDDKTVIIDGITLTVTTQQKAEISTSLWSHAFKLEYSNENIFGECSFYTYGGDEYGIIAPNGMQGYIIDAKNIKRLKYPFYIFDTWDMMYFDQNEAESYINGCTIKYIYVYDESDVFVVIYAQKNTDT